MYEPAMEQLPLPTDPQPLYPFPAVDAVLKHGESGTVIYVLQALLTELCADFVSPKAPAVNGLYDEATAHCIAQWQTVTGMPQNGEVDRPFWDMLATIYNARLL